MRLAWLPTLSMVHTFRTVRKVDVVADVGIGRGEDHRAFPLDRQEPLLQMQRDAAVSIVGPDLDGLCCERGHARAAARASMDGRVTPQVA
jgi:hypothetical protein